MKRKYAERSDWKRILQRKYAQAFLETDESKGYITLLHTIKVSAPLFVPCVEEERSIIDDGYM